MGRNHKCVVFGYNNFKNCAVLSYQSCAVLTYQTIVALFSILSQVSGFGSQQIMRVESLRRFMSYANAEPPLFSLRAFFSI